MKKDVTVTALLGISQQDVAVVLGVSPGQWSMYSSGKRDLPAPAMQMLGEILTYINAAEAASKDQEETQKKELIKHLEHLLRENKYRQVRLERKIAAMARKQFAQSRMLLLSEFLAQHEAVKKNAAGLSEVFKMKATKPAKISIQTLLSEQQHQRELLVFEEKLLVKKLEAL